MFDYSYFIVISVVLLNLVLGIIIDSFAELRKRNEDLDDRLNNVCYICCLERRTLERGENGGFAHHRETEHNPFFYFYFLMHLREKTDMGDELSGVESYVQSLVNSSDSSLHVSFDIDALCPTWSGLTSQALLRVFTVSETKRFIKTVSRQ